MATADAFVAELEEKSRNSVERVCTAHAETVAREAFSPADLLRLEQKAIVESIEVAALWLAEHEALEAKLALARRAGVGARRFEAVAARLEGLGVTTASFDVRFGGYSKLFAFFRSLQTREEQAGAGALTLGRINLIRWESLAAACEAKGDTETATLLRDVLPEDERTYLEAGRRDLLICATTEESQARARRAAFRTVEVLGDVYEPGLLRKFLSRSVKK